MVETDFHSKVGIKIYEVNNTGFYFGVAESLVFVEERDEIH